MIISIFLLSVVVGGTFLSSDNFTNAENDIKRYVILLSALVTILLISFYKKPLYRLKISIEHYVFSNGLVIISFFLVLQGLLQYFGILESNNVNFKITGSFENPAGFVAIQSLLFAVSLHKSYKHNNMNKGFRIMSVSVAILTFLSVVLSESRCGLLAIISAIFISLYFETKLKFMIIKHKWILFLLLTILFGLLLFLYNLKVDSANGRLLIWRICLNMFIDSPLFGFGHDSFTSNYMLYQADFFASHKQSAYLQLADNITHPFNEFIKLLVEHGLFGLIVVLLLLYIAIRNILQNNNSKKALGISVISTIIILAFFSYPFNYETFVFIAIILLIWVLPTKEPLASKWYMYFRKMVATMSIVSIVYLVYDCYYNLKWAAVYKRSLRGYTVRMLPHYNDLMSKLEENPYFLYNYSAELNHIGKYDESATIGKKCLTKINDYDVQLLMADNNYNLCRYEEALTGYITAHNMCPNRFVPLYKQFKIYKKCHNIDKMKEIGREILSKKIKVPSSKINFIISDVKRDLDTHACK